jgi:hypothetical protein
MERNAVHMNNVLTSGCHYSRREAGDKKDDLKKPATTQSKPETKRPQRDLAGVGEPQKKEDDSHPTSIPDVKKEEKRQK